MDAQDRTQWTTGELAHEAGVSVRALRHYDHIGLLAPESRSSGGHRRYSESDVERLYRIVALRRLGFGLADVAAMLEADRGQLIATVRRQLQAADTEIEVGMRLRDRLGLILGRLEAEGRLPPQELINTMKETPMSITIDRVYTRVGDDGETELADGTRIAKTDARLEIADLEELGAHLGLVTANSELPAEHAEWLTDVQNDLFDIGAELAREPRSREGDSLSHVTAAYVEWLEDRCDEANHGLPSLTSFLIPGGTALAAQLHVSRTVCRRVERRVLASGGSGNPDAARYLNRLSDLLFILARHATGDAEQLWEPGRRTRAGAP
jgi:cob(I)alamin adenosyltransferase